MQQSSRTALVIGAAVVIGIVVLLAGLAAFRSNDDTLFPSSSPSSVSEADLIRFDQVPASPREGVPSALDDMFDDRFPTPLVDPNEIRSGGPPPDGIPPIDDPAFEQVSTVAWLRDDEPVLALEVDGEARAYPIQILTWHEIVNDTVGSRPVTVSYCPLCNSAIAYDRRIADGRVLDFGTSGRLLNSSLVMYDRQTESLWSHFTGEAVVGDLTGQELDLIPMATVSWADFRESNPDGLVLSRETGFDRNYGRNPYPGYDDVEEQPFLFDGEVDGRLPAQARVIAVRGESDTAVIPQEDLFEERVVDVEVDGQDVVVLLTPGTASGLDGLNVADGRDVGATGAFVADLDGTPLRLEVDSSDESRFIDQTGTAWNVLGEAVDGPNSGRQLDAVEHLDTFWFAIATFSPDLELVSS